MTDDQKPDSPDVDEFLGNYLETCRRVGVETVSLERAPQLFDEWSEAIRDAARIGPVPVQQLELQPHLAMPPRVDIGQSAICCACS